MSSKTNLEKISLNASEFTVLFKEKRIRGSYHPSKDFIDIHLPEGNFRIKNPTSPKRKVNKDHVDGELTAPMPGKIVKIFVKEDEKIKKGDLLLVLEAMKMEHKILSPQEGIVRKIHFKEGDRVSLGDELIDLE